MGFRIYTGDYPVEALECIEVEGVKFFYRPVLVSDMDNMRSMDKDNPVAALQLVASSLILRVENLEDQDGNDIAKLTPEIVEALPLTIANEVVSKIMKTAGLNEEDENFSEPLSDTK
jgi:hypothetical protein